ncbi:MAG TPA: ATP-binding protein, partial [Candidatus Paceibacterota bacterium]
TDQLLDEKIKIEILLDSIGDGIIAIDRSWNITFSNEIASSISGWPKKEMIGRPFRDVIKFIREYDRKENISFIENAMVLGRMQQLQEKTSLIKKNGDEILIDDSASPIFNDDGKVVGATIIFRDASTTQEASNLRAGFQYASHQLNTPISKIMWSLELAIEEKDYDKRTKAIKEAYRSAQSVSKMSEQLFAVAQIDQDVVIPEYAEFELDVLIKDISKKSENSSFRSDVKISFNIANDIKKINSDKKMLSRILQELLDNAFKFNAQDGSIDISVRLIHGDIVFAIKDTGIGIVERDQALVFTKFFRGMNFDTSKISGAGLGLFISKAYTEILDGKIWFTSKPGETIFSFKLPLIHLETLK